MAISWSKDTKNWGKLVTQLLKRFQWGGHQVQMNPMDSGCYIFITNNIERDIKMCAKVRYHTVGMCELRASGVRSQWRFAPIGPPRVVAGG